MDPTPHSDDNYNVLLIIAFNNVGKFVFINFEL